MFAKLISFIFMFHFASSGSVTYSHLSKEQSDSLAAVANNICDKTAQQAKESGNKRLREAHQRHCIDHKPASLTGLVVAFYHLGLETKNKSEKEFFRRNLPSLSAIVRVAPDFPEPKAAWSVAGIVDELSGMTFDKKRNVIWTLGDSGTGPIIGRTTPGTFKSEKFQLDGASNRDWEAMVADDSGGIWALDVGDNLGIHKSVTLYRFRPESIKAGHIPVQRKIEVTYPDGARDVEAAVVSENKIYLIEKAYYRDAKISYVDISDNSPAKQKAVSFGTFPPLGPVTDAVLSNEGRLILLTYFGVFEMIGWKTKDKRTPKQLNDQILGQTEAITIVSGKVQVGREDGKVFADTEDLIK